MSEVINVQTAKRLNRMSQKCKWIIKRGKKKWFVCGTYPLQEIQIQGLLKYLG